MALNSFDITIKKRNRQLVSIKDFRYEDDHITFLFGESGIGKSLISKAIYGILDPEEFSVSINREHYSRYIASRQTKEIQENSCFVFQEPSSHLNPLMTLDAQLKEGNMSKRLRDSRILQRLWDTNDREIFQKILAVYPKPYRPSGGEKQRLLLAMAFLKIELFLETVSEKTKTLFVFDEPSGSLDNHFRDIFLSYLFETYQKKKYTVLLVTHDYSMISAVKNLGSKILADVSYKELILGQKGLRLNDFNPSQYLDWLKNQKLITEPIGLDKSKKALLRMEKSIEVYGRKLIVSKDPANSNQCPLEINPYSMIYLKAPSGVGKTTFAKSMMGLIPAKGLQITLKNLMLTERTSKRFWQKYVWGRQMAITFQHADEALNQNSTVIGSLSGLPKRMSRENITKLMKDIFNIEIDDRFLSKKVKYLSGGQKQKLSLMRSLVLDTDILILDEPFNGLDFESIVNVLSLIQEKQKAGKGILLISHNEEIFDTIIPSENVYYLHSQ